MSRTCPKQVALALSDRPVWPSPLRHSNSDVVARCGSEAGRHGREARRRVRRCLGDNCRSSAQTAPVGSSQVRLGRHSVECGLVACSRAWWNDQQNDHLSKRAGCPTARSRSARVRPQGHSGLTSRWMNRGSVEAPGDGWPAARPRVRAVADARAPPAKGTVAVAGRPHISVLLDPARILEKACPMPGC
jgi:hypothetical protein